MQTPELPVFLQPWYLDAVCEDGSWAAAVVEQAGKVVAIWPYFLKRKALWSYVTMPVFGRFMGPWILPEYRVPSKENPILEALLEQMPDVAAFEQDWHYSARNWLPLQWKGFRQTTRYSYTLDLTDEIALRDGLAPDYRNRLIPKARQTVTVQIGAPLAECYRLQELSYGRQGLQPPCSFEFLWRLDSALLEQGHREIFMAVDRETGSVVSALYLIWDQTAAYLLMIGDDPAFRSSGAGILLMWEAIEYSRNTLRLPRFDFLGSMIPSIERVRRQFGASQEAYFRVGKESSRWWQWARMIRRR